MIDSSEENECDNEYLFEIKDKNKWDCESILSTYSNIYNHPIIIKDSVSTKFSYILKCMSRNFK